MKSLLQVLRHHLPDLAKDSRTLSQTLSECTDLVKHIAGGQYFHLGIESEICFNLHNYEKFFTMGTSSSDNAATHLLEINIDGLPLFKSFPGQVWPILGMIMNSTQEILFTWSSMAYIRAKPPAARRC